jgi:hypothetical protein
MINTLSKTMYQSVLTNNYRENTKHYVLIAKTHKL